MGFALRLSPFFRARRLYRPPAFMRDRRGGAAVEFAIVGPVLLIILTGIFTYGGYFLTAHTIQQITNDAARAAIAGLDDDERLALARDAVRAGLDGQAFMRGEVAELSLARSGSSVSVRLTYDASDDLYWAFEALLPTPSPRISRTATIRLGGY